MVFRRETNFHKILGRTLQKWGKKVKIMVFGRETDSHKIPKSKMMTTTRVKSTMIRQSILRTSLTNNKTKLISFSKFSRSVAINYGRNRIGSFYQTIRQLIAFELFYILKTKFNNHCYSNVYLRQFCIRYFLLEFRLFIKFVYIL